MISYGFLSLSSTGYSWKEGSTITHYLTVERSMLHYWILYAHVSSTFSVRIQMHTSPHSQESSLMPLSHSYLPGVPQSTQ